jgi:hypothetical protein
MQKRTLL